MQKTLQQLSELISADVVGDPQFIVKGVADLKSASDEDLSFFAPNRFGGMTRSYETELKRTAAGAVLIDRQSPQIEGNNYLLTDHPSLPFQKIAELFHPPCPTGFQNIHPSAVIHPEAEISPNVAVGPCAVVDRGVKIGSGCQIGPQVFVGAESQIGENCIFHPGVKIAEGSKVGNRVEIQAGSVIGSSGFGYTTDEKGRHNKLKQLGNVLIEDDVEIGANVTIDRARLKTTIIRQGTKIDNLVQIAHNVEVGPHNLIVAQTGIAGSTKTGRHVVLGGQVGVNGHIELTDGVIVAARSAVMNSLKEPGKYYGEPAQTQSKFRRHWMHLLRLDRYAERIAALEKKLAENDN